MTMGFNYDILVVDDEAAILKTSTAKAIRISSALQTFIAGSPLFWRGPGIGESAIRRASRRSLEATSGCVRGDIEGEDSSFVSARGSLRASRCDSGLAHRSQPQALRDQILESRRKLL